MTHDDGLPYAYPLSDGGSCSPPNDIGFCSLGAFGDLPDANPIVNYTGGKVIWHQGSLGGVSVQGFPVPVCAT